MPDSTQGWKVNASKIRDSSVSISNTKLKTEIGEYGLSVNLNNLSKNEKCECLVDTFFPEHLTKLEGVARKTFFIMI